MKFLGEDLFKEKVLPEPLSKTFSKGGKESILVYYVVSITYESTFVK